MSDHYDTDRDSVPCLPGTHGPAQLRGVPVTSELQTPGGGGTQSWGPRLLANVFSSPDVGPEPGCTDRLSAAAARGWARPPARVAPCARESRGRVDRQPPPSTPSVTGAPGSALCAQWGSCRHATTTETTARVTGMTPLLVSAPGPGGAARPPPGSQISPRTSGSRHAWAVSLPGEP